MNFPDHTKIVLWDSAKSVRFVDKKGGVSIYSLSDATNSTSEVVDRLQIAAKELFEWAEVLHRGKKVFK